MKNQVSSLPCSLDRPLSPAAELRIVPLEFTKDHIFKRFWRCRGTIPGPHTCKACALPLSYIPKLQSQWGLSREKGLIAKALQRLRSSFRQKKHVPWGISLCVKGVYLSGRAFDCRSRGPRFKSWCPLRIYRKLGVSSHAQRV